MSICSDVDIKRQEALERIHKRLVKEYSDMMVKALNSMKNDDLGSYLHTDMYFYHVFGKGKLKESWEE